ncbi:hypothetical protein MPLA_140359 [Mesorhizobium sp. ORS 3359]|nr:hypothetical protein MPLA_140359 [Mesorhizobium sp. ORS 3359]
MQLAQCRITPTEDWFPLMDSNHDSRLQRAPNVQPDSSGEFAKSRAIQRFLVDVFAEVRCGAHAYI